MLGLWKALQGEAGRIGGFRHLPELVLGFQAAEIAVVLWLCSLLNSHLYAKSCKRFWKQLYVYLWQLLWGGVIRILLWIISNPLVLMQVLLSFLLREKGGRSGPKYLVLAFHCGSTIAQTRVSNVVEWLLLLSVKSKYLCSEAPGVGKIIAKYLCLTFSVFSVACLSQNVASVFWYLLRNCIKGKFMACVLGSKQLKCWFLNRKVAGLQRT